MDIEISSEVTFKSNATSFLSSDIFRRYFNQRQSKLVLKNSLLLRWFIWLMAKDKRQKAKGFAGFNFLKSPLYDFSTIKFKT